MRGLATSLAAIVLSSAGAAAQEEGGQQGGGSTNQPASAQVLETAKGQLIRGSDLEGGTIYVTGDPENHGWTTSTIYEEIGDGWSEVGQVVDMVISQDSAYAGIVAKIGERPVFLSIQDIALVLHDDAVAYVTKLSESDLSDLPDLTEEVWQ